ncbi:MAG: MCE family protein [Marinilabiliales bacterium]|nr:MAG: MCE family protein [Marinilabiliales bacterium]
MTVKLSKEAKVGLLVIITLAFFIWGYGFLKGKNVFSPTNDYYALYDRVGGLMESGHVMLSGHRVGYVDDIRFTGGQRYLQVRLSIDRKIELPEGTVARIINSDFMGTKAVDLIMGESSERHNPGDTLRSEVEPDLVEGLLRQVEPVRDKAESMLASVDSVFVIMRSILDKDVQESISEGVINAGDAIAGLKRSVSTLEGMLTDQENRFGNIMSNLEYISDNFVSVSDSLAQSDLLTAVSNVNNVLEELNHVMKRLNRGEGTAGKLLADEELYNNLESAARNLDQLVIDLREHPGRYVHFSIFGRKRE